MLDKSKLTTSDYAFSPKTLNQRPPHTEIGSSLKRDLTGSLKKKSISKTSTKVKPSPISQEKIPPTPYN